MIELATIAAATAIFCWALAATGTVKAASGNLARLRETVSLLGGAELDDMQKERLARSGALDALRTAGLILVGAALAFAAAAIPVALTILLGWSHLDTLSGAALSGAGILMSLGVCAVAVFIRR